MRAGCVKNVYQTEGGSSRGGRSSVYTSSIRSLRNFPSGNFQKCMPNFNTYLIPIEYQI